MKGKIDNGSRQTDINLSYLATIRWPGLKFYCAGAVIEENLVVSAPKCGYKRGMNTPEQPIIVTINFIHHRVSHIWVKANNRGVSFI